MRPLSFWGGQGFNIAKIQGCKVTAVISGATCSEASSHGHDPWGRDLLFKPLLSTAFKGSFASLRMTRSIGREKHLWRGWRDRGQPSFLIHAFAVARRGMRRSFSGQSARYAQK